jgi:hypothetical protein
MHRKLALSLAMSPLLIGQLRGNPSVHVLEYLVSIINAAYLESQHDITGSRFQRTSATELGTLSNIGELFIATSDNELLVPESVVALGAPSPDTPTNTNLPAARIFGVFKLHAISPTLASFGMLVVPPEHRRTYKLGQRMLSYAEARGYATIQIELLRPTDGQPHAFKDFLVVWYARAGYSIVRVDDAEEALRGLNAEMGRPAELVIMQKVLA